MYAIAVEGLAELDDIRQLPQKIIQAATRSINRTTEWSRTQASKEMREQVNFPARYLSGSSGRLAITRRAGRNDLSAILRGRQEPTSLARFAKERNPKAARKKGGVNVMVAPGESKFMNRAFLLNLNGNLGLAIRLKQGETLRNKSLSVRSWRGIYILYGPSVDQVFRGVATDLSDEIADRLENEFNRLLEI